MGIYWLRRRLIGFIMEEVDNNDKLMISCRHYISTNRLPNDFL